MDQCKVIFQPQGKEVSVSKGTDILTAALKCGIHIYNSCGGEGVCGRCKVVVKDGEVKSEFSGRLTYSEREKGYVLACRAAIKGNAVIEIPPESLIEKLEILTEDAKKDRLTGLYLPVEQSTEQLVGIKERIFTKSPLSSKIYLQLPVPTLDDNCSDLERIYREIRKKKDNPIMQIGLANIKKLGELLRSSDWKVTVTLGNRNKTTEIVIIEPGDTTSALYGISVDVGTTTIVACIVDLNTNRVLGRNASYNPQANFGEDVISRMIYAQHKDGLEKLHHVVIDAINGLIQNLAAQNGLTLDDIKSVIAAGNTTMTHLLLKIDPTYIRKDPYVPTANFVPVIRAAEAGIKINPRGLLWCVPGISSYVGGDITAGILATGMDQSKEVSILIDLGTNGEIVIGNSDWLVACSTSAGPCFEGGGIKCGTRAMQGAVQRISIDKETDTVSYETIGNTRPKGICGSGLIDAIGELLRAKIIDKSGKFITSSSLRIRQTEEGPEYLIAEQGETELSYDIVITETDIKNVINSKGAIFTGLEVLLKKIEMSFDDISRVFIAGGLGTSLEIEKAIMIGLMPDININKFTFIGNSSIAGARMVLLSGEAMEKTQQIAEKTTYIELSASPEFMNEYTAALFLPHTNMELFPTVKDKIG